MISPEALACCKLPGMGKKGGNGAESDRQHLKGIMTPDYHVDSEGIVTLSCERYKGIGASREEARVNYLLTKREAGERLTDPEEAVIAYSPFGTAAKSRR